MKLDSGQELIELDYLLEVEHQVVIQTAHATRPGVNEQQQGWSLDEKQPTGGQTTGSTMLSEAHHETPWDTAREKERLGRLLQRCICSNLNPIPAAASTCGGGVTIVVPCSLDRLLCDPSCLASPWEHREASSRARQASSFASSFETHQAAPDCKRGNQQTSV
jgi:hypothetical protein